MRRTRRLLGFFSQIPTRLRMLVAPLGQYQWVGLDLISQMKGFAPFLESEIFEGHIQYISACFALSSVEKMPRRRRSTFARTLMTRKRPELISELSGICLGPAAVRNLYKLGEKPLSRSTYLAFLKSCSEPRSAKIFGHARQIAPNAIKLWKNAPTESRIAGALEFLLGNCQSDGKSKTPMIRPDQIRSAPLDQRWSWFSFPPIPGSEQLQPITSAAEMRREGRRMRSCLGAEAAIVQAGEVYFYKWTGRERATVMLQRVEDGDWTYGEALGVGNRRLRRQTGLFIRHVVAQQLDAIASRAESDRYSEPARTTSPRPPFEIRNRIPVRGALTFELLSHNDKNKITRSGGTTPE